jgi:hypothetical protein
LCIFLLFNQFTIDARADIPGRYTWQIERVEQSSAKYIVNSFEGGTPDNPYGDIAWAMLDIPAQFFPLELWEIHSWHQNNAYYDHGLAAKFYLYKGSDGQAKYLFQHSVLLPGKNVTRLRVECSQCRAIFTPADGPHVGIGLMYVTEWQYAVWSGSTHIVVGNQGCWPGYNLVYDYSAQEWVNPCALGMPGNFAIRVVFEPLCPQRLGDNDGDFDIDLRDYAMLQREATGPTGDVFGTSGVYVDLDNDYAIDFGDFTILAGDYTGPDNDVVCPEFPGPTLPLDSALRLVGSLADHPIGSINLPADLPTGGLRWTYTQVAVVLFVATVLALTIGPCVRLACRSTGLAIFVANSSTVNDLEQDRIRLAIDRIGELPGDDAANCHLLLNQSAYYNPQFTEYIKVNRVAPEDDTSFVATHDVSGRICLHYSYVTGDRWYHEGIDGLALLLFSEWQHIEQAQWTERQCQQWLQQWRQQVGWQYVAPEVHHEWTDGGGQP